MATRSCGRLNFTGRRYGFKQQQTDGREDKRLGVLGEQGGGRQRSAGLVAAAWTGNGRRVFFGTAIQLAEPARRINQAARSGWQPHERQQHGHDCLDPLHEESNTTNAWREQSGRLAAPRSGVPDGSMPAGAGVFSPFTFPTSVHIELEAEVFGFAVGGLLKLHDEVIAVAIRQLGLADE
jgi:hypothetical protein